jgi:hypothetical protein
MNEMVVNHGYHVYVSERDLAQKSILDFGFLPAALGAAGVAAVLNRKYRPSSKEKGPTAKQEPG